MKVKHCLGMDKKQNIAKLRAKLRLKGDSQYFLVVVFIIHLILYCCTVMLSQKSS